MLFRSTEEPVRPLCSFQSCFHRREVGGDRCSYSNSLYEKPHAVQNMLLAGATVTLTDHLDLYLEYVNERVDGDSLPGRNGDFFNGIEWVINWHF